MAAVVVIHTVAKAWMDGTPGSFDWNVYDLYDSAVRWAVPAFVMISGSIFLNPHKLISIKGIYSKYFLKICIVILVWSTVYGLLYKSPNQWGGVGDFVVFFSRAILGHYHMWFLYMIAGLYIITPVLRLVTRSASITRYFVILGFLFNVALPFAATFIEMPTVDSLIALTDIKMPLGYSFYFVLGYWVSSSEFASKGIGRALAVGGLVVGIAATFLLTLWISVSKDAPTDTYYGYFSLPVFLESICIFYLGRSIELKRSGMQKAVKTLSGSALGIYLVHIIVLDCLNRFGLSVAICTPVISVPIVAICVICISMGISLALSRIPFVGRWIV